MKENNWKAGCNESCTSGLVGGSKKSADDHYSNYGSAVAPLDSTQLMEGKLDLNEHLIKNPPATFFVRVSGDSMIGAGIHPDDLLVVDRSINPKYTKITITEEMSFHIWGVVTYVVHKTWVKYL